MGDEWPRLETLLEEQKPQPKLEEKLDVKTEPQVYVPQPSVYKPEPRYGC